MPSVVNSNGCFELFSERAFIQSKGVYFILKHLHKRIKTVKFWCCRLVCVGEIKFNKNVILLLVFYHNHFLQPTLQVKIFTWSSRQLQNFRRHGNQHGRNLKSCQLFLPYCFRSFVLSSKLFLHSDLFRFLLFSGVFFLIASQIAVFLQWPRLCLLWNALLPLIPFSISVCTEHFFLSFHFSFLSFRSLSFCPLRFLLFSFIFTFL